MNTIHQIRSLFLRLSGVAIGVAALAGCSTEVGAPQEPSVSTTQSSETVVPAGADAISHGIAQYGVRIQNQTTYIRLFDAKGSVGGEVMSYTVEGGRHVAYSRTGVQIEFEYTNNQIAAWVNGASRGTRSLDASAVAGGNASAGSFDLSDVASDAKLLITVSADGALHDTVSGLRADVPYMFGLTTCPAWVVIGSCVAAGTPPGAAVCAYCAIAWL